MLLPKDNHIKSLLNSFGYAVRGLLLCLKEERNLRIHISASCWVIWLGLVCNISQGAWSSLAVCCGLVICGELFNTAVEATVDLLSPGYHPVARRAKDISAAGVLMGAVFAVVTGAIVFWDKLFVITGWFAAAAGKPLQIAALLFCALLTLGFIFSYPRLFKNPEENQNDQA